MEDPESAERPVAAPSSALRALIPGRAFLASRKGQLLLAEWVVSFITFICYVASTAVSLMTVPLIEFLWALFTFFAYSTKLNEQLKGILWPLLLFVEEGYKLPDGNVIKFHNQKFRCPEALFTPDNIGMEATGSSLFPGINLRLTKEVTKMAPADCHVKVSALPKPMLAAWIGGTIVLSLSDFQEICDFIRCVSAAIIYFVISLVAVSKYSCGASKVAAVLGFIATIVYAFDFYIIFNDLIKFLKKEDDGHEEPQRRKSEDEDTDFDSD